MKKSRQKLQYIRNWMTGTLVFGTCMALFSATPYPVFATEVDLVGATSSNISRRNYSARSSSTYLYETTTRWATGEYSNLVALETGYLRVEYIDGDEVTLEEYDENFIYQGTLPAIEVELSQFVDFLACDTGYFFLFSGTNPEEQDSVEVVRVVFYDKEWNRINSASITGANTTGQVKTADMALSGDHLLIHTCHQMYADSSGVNHQANMHFTVDVETMEVLVEASAVRYTGTGYVSHSFQQFLDVSSDGFIVTGDHGDAYPRSIPLFSWPVADQVGASTSNSSYPTMSEPFSIYGDYSATGYGNTTGLRLGGLEVGSEAVMVVGSSLPQDEGIVNGSGETDFNVFVATTPRDNFTTEASSQTWITEYDGTTYASNPFLVEVTEDAFLLLWNEFGEGTFDRLHWTTLDGKGEQIGEIYSGIGLLSEVQPVLSQEGEVAWYTTLNSAPTFYTLDLSTNEVTEHSVAVETSITLSAEALSLTVGETATVSATVVPEITPSTEITWSVNEEDLVTLTPSGNTVSVEGVGVGTCQLTATVEGVSVSIPVTITKEEELQTEVTSLQLDVETLTLSLEESYPLVVTFSPTDATETEITWTSSQDSVARVSTTGVVTAVSQGEAAITATAQNGVSASCVVTVEENDIKEYTITFDPQGGTLLTGGTQLTDADGFLSSLPVPTRSSFTFQGWYTTITGGTLVTTATAFTEDTTLYARWEAVESTEVVTVTFDPNGGSLTDTSLDTLETLESGVLSGAPPIPTREGYTFLGWYTALTEGELVTASTVFYDNATVYALWKEVDTSILATVTFVPVGGTLTTYTVMVESDHSLASLPVPTRSGYTFKGWYTALVDGSMISTATEFLVNTTVYAQWESQGTDSEVTVIFDATGGSLSTTSLETATTGLLSSLPTPTRSGYTFKGWYTAVDTGSAITIATTFTQDTVVYARWELGTDYNQFTVTFEAQEGVAVSSLTTADGTLLYLPTTTRTGYTFLGWYTASEGGFQVTVNQVYQDDTTLYAQWETTIQSEFVIVFDTQSGSGVASTVTVNGSLTYLPTTVRTGYTFLGWYTAKTGGTQVTVSSVFVDDAIVYAQWELTTTEEEEEEEGDVVLSLSVVNSWVEGKFTDVSNRLWYYAPVRYVHELGLMNGTSDTSFSPELTTSRAMVVTMLHALAGKPATTLAGFSDVSYDAYYSRAVGWAKSVGVADGIGNQEFGVDSAVTREQLVVMLYSFDSALGGSGTLGDTSITFKDAGSISSWAVDATAWASSHGLISGRSSGDFSPKDTATRAEVAVILQNMIEYYS